ncbi:unknown (plasmid) [Haloarcula marismortui ATCC 43049]|uniref:Uncharacterized protein n=1 Tax=Haloarcula marismortui (strain ATCC 43049 / DSM 3752 / JCM 8966 / VKM B-1809) TaxID=272569 RepID=Q5V860_HALMA|nr:hypothetical protein [Haloarcula marismortui]AAV44264.1 unknown [Haloarcula marismortui ATCC 43049]QCP89413.1 hypothetical protein E6P14_00315 [Haloarcula marismortui ATCC 43049]
MTESQTNPEDDSDDGDATVQLGARVDKDLAELVKGLVKHKHAKIRGPLGRSYEKALEYYIGVHLFQHPDDLEVIAEASDIEDKERAVERLREAIDNVGPDLTGVKQALEDPQREQVHHTEQPAGRGLSVPQAETQSMVLSEQKEWEQSSVRRSVLGEDMSMEDETLDRIAERVAEKLENRD